MDPADMVNRTVPMDCRKLVSKDMESVRFWAAAFSLAAMNGLVIFGNILVALAPFLNCRLKNPGHYFIASLAWADFGLGIFIIPFAALIQTRGGIWPYGSYACQLWQTMDVMFCTASIYSLVAITFDRYVAVTKPLMYKSWMTTRTCVLTIALVWLASIAVSAPSLFLSWSRNAHLVTTACLCTQSANGAPYILYSSIASFYLPMIIVSYFYLRIYVTVRKIRLNSNRGILNVRRKSPNAATTSLNNNTEIGDGVADASTAAASMADSQNKKINLNNRIFGNSKSNSRQEKKRKDDESSSLLLPVPTPPNHRRTSEGPVLRIHKGRYHARRSSGKSVKSHLDLETNTVSKKYSSGHSHTHIAGMISNEIDPPRRHRNRSLTEIQPQSPIRYLCQTPNSNLSPPLGLAPSPSPSQITLSLAGEFAPQNQSKTENIDRSNQKIDSDIWLRFALPSQVVSAWAQRMTALHRYRRKLSLELRALKTVVMVTGCFFVCWTGFCVVYTMQALPTCHKSNWWPWTKEPAPNDSCVSDWVFNLFSWLGYANSAANPIVYGAMNAQFRRTFHRLVGKVSRARFV